jgi:photosystem II stability/assembly factor-like uncharacterized protein
MNFKNLFFFIIVFVMSVSEPVQAQTNSWELTNLVYRGSINTITTNDSGYIFAGTETDGVYRSTDNGNTWNQVNNGLTQNRIFYMTTSPNGNIFASVNGLVYKSSDNGEDWMPLNLGTIISFVRIIAINSRGCVFAGGVSSTGGGAICRSTDDGINWTTVTQGNEQVYSMAVNSVGEIFAGGLGPQIIKSTDNGNSWNFLTNLNNGVAYYSPLSLAIGSADIVYVGCPGGVFRSTDDGADWTWQNNGLTLNYMQAILANSVGLVFAGTERTIYLSSSSADSWFQFSSGLPDTTLVLSLNERFDGVVLVGTYNRGLFKSARSTTLFGVDGRKRLWFSDTASTGTIDTIHVRNHASASLAINSVVSTIPEYSVTPSTAIIQAGDSAGFEIIAHPHARGVLTGYVIFNSTSFLTYDTISFRLFVGVPLLNVNTQFLEFGTVPIGQSKDTSLTITNPGYDTLSIQTISSTNTEFSGSTVSLTVPPHGVRQITVKFSPNTCGDQTGLLTFVSNSSTSPDSVSLYGEGLYVVAVNDKPVQPSAQLLAQNFPNPFNPMTRIVFSLPSPILTTVRVYNMLGQEVATLVSQQLNAGEHIVEWDGKDVVSGVYFYRIQAGSWTETKKMLLIK